MSRASNLAGFSTSLSTTIDLNAGIITATSFVGNLTGTATAATSATTATTANSLATNATGTNLTLSGNLTVNGTQTVINTNVLDIADKTIGIGSTSAPSDSLANGAGIIIYGTTNKTLTWDNANSRMAFSTNVYAPKYFGDGSGLQGVVSGVELRQAGSTVGTSITTVNFQSGATLTAGSGIGTVTIAAGIQTEATTPNNTITFLDLSKQDHKLTVSGITTISCTGGTEGESHTVRIVNSGIATVGFSTYFLFPSGSPPSLPTASGTINLISFTVHRVGAAGTQLLAGAGLNYQ